MEPLWSPAGATGGNQWRIAWPRKQQKQATLLQERGLSSRQLARESASPSRISGKSSAGACDKSISPQLASGVAVALMLGDDYVRAREPE